MPSLTAVERVWTGNAYRNYNYLIACPDTGEALAIDPLDSEKTLATARVKGWQITQVLNTHEHHDHIGGNAAARTPPPPSPRWPTKSRSTPSCGWTARA